jgi:ribonuclease P protein component
MMLIPNSLGINRLGLVTPKAKIRLSSTRNRTRRFLKEAYRLTKNKLKCGHDIILILNNPVDSLPSAQAIISEMFDKAKIRTK